MSISTACRQSVALEREKERERERERERGGAMSICEMLKMVKQYEHFLHIAQYEIPYFNCMMRERERERARGRQRERWWEGGRESVRERRGWEGGRERESTPHNDENHA